MMTPPPFPPSQSVSLSVSQSVIGGHWRSFEVFGGHEINPRPVIKEALWVGGCDWDGWLS